MDQCTVPNQFTVYLVGPPSVLDDTKPDRKPEPQSLTRNTQTNYIIILSIIFGTLSSIEDSGSLDLILIKILATAYSERSPPGS